jgi:2-hydroxychromene-2-carboxylate isomerase
VGYELHPETPAGGAPLSVVMHDPDATFGYVRSFAAGFGIRDLVAPRTLPNTRRAHAVGRHAQDMGKLEAYRASAFDAYWRRGGGLESDEDLAAIARTAGLDPAAALAAAGDPAVLERVDAARREALRAGVAGIPTFDFGPVRVVGCQRYDVLADAARRAGARRRGATPAS